MAMAYRKKPVVVEAVQWTGENHAEMCEFIDPEAFEIIPRIGLVIHTLEGDHHASPGDYIIKGVNGEFYPCKPDIFAKTYESSTLTPPNEWVSVEDELPKLPDCDKCSMMVNTARKGNPKSFPMIYERAIVRGKRVERWKYYWDRIADEPPDYWMYLPKPPTKET